MLMLYATSPLARQLYEQLMTGNPFEIDIKLDDVSANRNAEIVETYLKTIGKRIEFIKKPKKKKNPVLMSPVKYIDKGLKKPVVFFQEGQTVDPIFTKWQREKTFHPVEFYPVVFLKPAEEIDKLIEENNKQYQAEIEAAEKEERGE